MRKRRFISLAGFTLIEITIALLILAIGLVSLLTLFPVGFDAASRAINTTIGTLLAQELLEEAKKAGYDNVGGTQGGKFGAPYENFEYRVNVTSNIDGLELKQVDVEVSWPAGDVNQKSVLLSTYIAKYEP